MDKKKLATILLKIVFVLFFLLLCLIGLKYLFYMEYRTLYHTDMKRNDTSSIVYTIGGLEWDADHITKSLEE